MQENKISYKEGLRNKKLTNFSDLVPLVIAAALPNNVKEKLDRKA